MLKILTFMIISFTGCHSFSAKWEKIEIKDSAFVLLEHVNLYSSVYQLKEIKDSEDFIQSLKQLTYIVRSEWGEYSTPDSVDIYHGDLDFSTLSSDDTRTEPEALNNEVIGSLTEYNLLRQYDVEIYEGLDGNKWGDCANIYLYEKKSLQVGVFSLCYSI